MDQWIFWNDLNEVDTENLPDPPPVFPIAEKGVDVNMWSPTGPSSSRNEEPKVELDSRTEDRKLEINNISNQADNDRLFLQNPTSHDFVKNSDGHDGASGRSSGLLQLSSSGGYLNLHGSSSIGSGFLMENFEGQSGKRKSIEEVPARIPVSPRHSDNTVSSIDFFGVSENPECLERNCRARTDLPPHHPFTRALNSVPNSQPLPWNGASSSRISRSLGNAAQRTGSSTRARATTAQRLIGLRVESNSVQDLTSWDFNNGSVGIGHMASHIHQFYQHPANGDASREMTHESSDAIHGHPQHYARSASLTDTGSGGVASVPARSLAAARVERSRALSQQIRDAIELVRRAENAHLEDILLFDRSAFYERVLNRRDRHRELRLDVDNMSYEELLALEERIGNVSTGLDEETVLKYLKQRKYISLSEETPNEVEPCCVCQEEYSEGEDVGRLDCRHDFHAACIKQWLAVKNSCPICKTTGLDT